MLELTDDIIERTAKAAGHVLCHTTQMNIKKP